MEVENDPVRETSLGGTHFQLLLLLGGKVYSCKLRQEWKMDPLKMYFHLKMRIFQPAVFFNQMGSCFLELSKGSLLTNQSAQIIATSHDRFPPNGGCEILFISGKPSGWWNSKWNGILLGFEPFQTEVVHPCLSLALGSHLDTTLLGFGWWWSFSIVSELLVPSTQWLEDESRDGFKTWTSSFGDVLTDFVTMGFITIKSSCEGTCFLPFPTILT